VTKAMVVGKSVVEYSPDNIVSQEIEIVWKRVLATLNMQ